MMAKEHKISEIHRGHSLAWYYSNKARALRNHKAYYDNTPGYREKGRQRAKQWHHDNKDKTLEGKKKYAKEHPDKIREYSRKYYKKHAEKIREYSKKWRLDHLARARELGRKYYQKNKDKVTQLNKELSYKALCIVSDSDHPKCIRCGCDDVRFLEVNHKNGGGNKERKEARNRGGSTMRRDIVSGHRSISDLEVLCKPCNAIHALELAYGKVPLITTFINPKS